MAYNFSKGNRKFGDITFEDDADTGIDFEADTVKIETGGAERVVVTNSDITLSGDIIVDQFIKHNGDANTKINFTDDRIQFDAGGITFIGMHKKGSSPHQVTINNGNNNIDFVVNSNNNNKDPILRCDASAAAVGIAGVDAPTCALDIGSDTIRIRNTKTPSSASDFGQAGEICWDANYLYICVAIDTWKRIPLDTW